MSKTSEDYQIYFIDYGNTSSVEPINIRRMPDELVKIPACAMFCYLDGWLFIYLPQAT